MSIAKRLEEQKKYRELLIKLSHLFDSLLSDIKGNDICNHEELSFTIHLASLNNVIETIERRNFASPLIPLMDTNLSCSNGPKHTPGDLYDWLSQIPEDAVIQMLSNQCDQIGNYSLIESFRQKDKETFIQSFEQIEDKRSLFDKTNSLIHIYEMRGDAIEMFNKKIYDPELVYSMGREGSHLMDMNGPLDYHYEKALQQLCNGFLPIGVSLNDLLDDYKKLIKKSIELNLTPIEFDVINDMVIRHGFVDLYNELYPQCLKEVQRDIFKKEGKPLEPIDFPEHLGIEPEKKESFLRALYKELVGKSYISPNREDDFVYLLGGPIARPDDLMPINWLKGSNRNMRQIQCFFIAYLDIPQKVENKNDHNWTVLAPLNTWDGETMTTFNNPSNAFVKGINEINRFKNTLSVISSNI